MSTTLQRPILGLPQETGMTPGDAVVTQAVVENPPRPRPNRRRLYIACGVAVLIPLGIGVSVLSGRSEPAVGPGIQLPAPASVPGPAEDAPGTDAAPPQATSDTASALEVIRTLKPGAGQPETPAPAPEAPAVEGAAEPPAAPPAPAPAATPPDPTNADAATTVLNLVPRPMSRDEEVQILDLVTKMAVQVRDLRVVNDGYREQNAALTSSLEERLRGVERRVSMFEARNAVAAVSQPVSPAPVLAVAALAPGPSPARVEYRIVAASPGLVVLGVGSGGPVKPFVIGDKVDDFHGKVETITPVKGKWIVKTENGRIENSRAE